MGSVYKCEIKNELNVISKYSRAVTSIKGQHPKAVNNDWVAGIHSKGKNILFMPTGINKFFKNIKLIDITHGRIKEIHQSDLKPFPKLVYCGFKDNDIEILEEGLFEHNPELEMISFWNNKILYVSSNIFSKLLRLTSLFLDDNQCIKMRADRNQLAVKYMIKQVEQKCSLSPYEIEDDSGKNQKLISNFSDSLDRIKRLESNFSLLDGKFLV